MALVLGLRCLGPGPLLGPGSLGKVAFGDGPVSLGPSHGPEGSGSHMDLSGGPMSSKGVRFARELQYHSEQSSLLVDGVGQEANRNCLGQYGDEILSVGGGPPVSRPEEGGNSTARLGVHECLFGELLKGVEPSSKPLLKELKKEWKTQDAARREEFRSLLIDEWGRRGFLVEFVVG